MDFKIQLFCLVTSFLEAQDNVGHTRLVISIGFKFNFRFEDVKITFQSDSFGKGENEGMERRSYPLDTHYQLDVFFS